MNPRLSDLRIQFLTAVLYADQLRVIGYHGNVGLYPSSTILAHKRERRLLLFKASALLPELYLIGLKSLSPQKILREPI